MKLNLLEFIKIMKLLLLDVSLQRTPFNSSIISIVKIFIIEM